jgi:hypothetical protein
LNILGACTFNEDLLGQGTSNSSLMFVTQHFDQEEIVRTQEPRHVNPNPACNTSHGIPSRAVLSLINGTERDQLSPTSPERRPNERGRDPVRVRPDCPRAANPSRSLAVAGGRRVTVTPINRSRSGSLGRHPFHRPYSSPQLPAPASQRRLLFSSLAEA